MFHCNGLTQQLPINRSNRKDIDIDKNDTSYNRQLSGDESVKSIDDIRVRRDRRNITNNNNDEKKHLLSERPSQRGPTKANRWQSGKGKKSKGVAREHQHHLLTEYDSIERAVSADQNNGYYLSLGEDPLERGTQSPNTWAQLVDKVYSRKNWARLYLPWLASVLLLLLLTTGPRSPADAAPLPPVQWQTPYVVEPFVEQPAPTLAAVADDVDQGQLIDDGTEYVWVQRRRLNRDRSLEPPPWLRTRPIRHYSEQDDSNGQRADEQQQQQQRQAKARRSIELDDQVADAVYESLLRLVIENALEGRSVLGDLGADEISASAKPGNDNSNQVVADQDQVLPIIDSKQPQVSGADKVLLAMAPGAGIKLQPAQAESMLVAGDEIAAGNNDPAIIEPSGAGGGLRLASLSTPLQMQLGGRDKQQPPMDGGSKDKSMRDDNSEAAAAAAAAYRKQQMQADGNSALLHQMQMLSGSNNGGGEAAGVPVIAGDLLLQVDGSDKAPALVIDQVQPAESFHVVEDIDLIDAEPYQVPQLEDSPQQQQQQQQRALIGAADSDGLAAGAPEGLYAVGRQVNGESDDSSDGPPLSKRAARDDDSDGAATAEEIETTMEYVSPAGTFVDPWFEKRQLYEYNSDDDGYDSTVERRPVDRDSPATSLVATGVQLVRAGVLQREQLVQLATRLRQSVEDSLGLPRGSVASLSPLAQSNQLMVRLDPAKIGAREKLTMLQNGYGE